MNYVILRDEDKIFCVLRESYEIYLEFFYESQKGLAIRGTFVYNTNKIFL